MPHIEHVTELLVDGDIMTWKEFERRWEAMPELKRAELIGGVVHIMAPLSSDHADSDQLLAMLVGVYRVHTPGCSGGGNATLRILGDAPQPDQHLRVLEKYGGNSRIAGKYVMGAPELVIEVTLSSHIRDLGKKKELYHRAGVKEYVTIILGKKQVRWLVRKREDYSVLSADKLGIFHSTAFPGFWLNAPALFDENPPDLLKTLHDGLNTPEHAAFVRKLAAAKK